MRALGAVLVWAGGLGRPRSAGACTGASGTLARGRSLGLPPSDLGARCQRD